MHAAKIRLSINLRELKVERTVLVSYFPANRRTPSNNGSSELEQTPARKKFSTTAFSPRRAVSGTIRAA